MIAQGQKKNSAISAAIAKPFVLATVPDLTIFDDTITAVQTGQLSVLNVNEHCLQSTKR